MALANVHEIDDEETYLELRNVEIKRGENGDLFRYGGDSEVYLDIRGDANSNAAIGYGWDLRVNDADLTEANLAQIGVILTPAQRSDLDSYRAGDINSATFQDRWSDIIITEAQATELLNIRAERDEADLTDRLVEYYGSDDLPYSEERAATVSLIYNLGSARALPTQIRLTASDPSSPEEEYGQRAGIWYEIHYGSNSLTQDPALWRGIQLRRSHGPDGRN